MSRVEDERIENVFDLALYIFDECSRVFFDRTKPLDQRPQVMDIFSKAISQMVCVSFGTFCFPTCGLF